MLFTRIIIYHIFYEEQSCNMSKPQRHLVKISPYISKLPYLAIKFQLWQSLNEISVYKLYHVIWSRSILIMLSASHVQAWLTHIFLVSNLLPPPLKTWESDIKFPNTPSHETYPNIIHYWATCSMDNMQRSWIQKNELLIPHMIKLH